MTYNVFGGMLNGTYLYCCSLLTDASKAVTDKRQRVGYYYYYYYYQNLKQNSWMVEGPGRRLSLTTNEAKLH